MNSHTHIIHFSTHLNSQCRLSNQLTGIFAQDTCAINVFTVEDGEFTLVSLNDTCHLQDLP